MPICPVCKYDYVNGETECIDCGVTLVDELPTDSDVALDDIKFAPFRNYPNRLQAEMIRGALANEGVPSIIKIDEAFGFAEMGTSSSASVVLWVAEDSQELAKQIADQIMDQSI